MFKKEPRGKFETSGFVNTYYRFVSGNIRMVRTFTEEEYQSLIQSQREHPTGVMRYEETKRKWWMFKDEFYIEDEGLSSEEVKALILLKQNRNEERLRRAVLLMENKKKLESNNREPIPEEVKLYVIARDQGKCVRCGSDKDIEYDHDIPVSKGGSNTEKNIRILCKECNRKKWAHIQ